MCHFWAPLLLFSYLVLILDHSLLIAYFAILVTYRDNLLYISRGTNPLICGLFTIYLRLSFLSLPDFSGPGLLSLSPVFSCKGPFSSSLPCSVSVALPQIHQSLSYAA